MIKTLKSELKLRPTYDEMIGMIESQGDPNRPSIENIIDRRATIFRNNQFGSQFDNVDFLGLKKQEEDKVKNEMRQAQLRLRSMATGSSMGVLSATSSSVSASGINTPREVEFYDVDDFIAEEIARVQSEIDAHNQKTQKARDRATSSASSDLADVHSQSLPVGVPVHSMASDEGSDKMPDLESVSDGERSSPSGRSRDEEEEDEGSLTDKIGLVGDFDPDNLINNQDIKSTGLLFQLYVRDLLSPEIMELTDKLPNEQRKKQYLVSIIEGLKETAEWQQSGFAGKTVKQEAKKFREMRKMMKKKPTNQESASSSGGIGSAIASGAKAVGGAVLNAGKEVAKDVALAVAQDALASII